MTIEINLDDENADLFLSNYTLLVLSSPVLIYYHLHRVVRFRPIYFQFRNPRDLFYIVAATLGMLFYIYSEGVLLRWCQWLNRLIREIIERYYTLLYDIWALARIVARNIANRPAIAYLPFFAIYGQIYLYISGFPGIDSELWASPSQRGMSFSLRREACQGSPLSRLMLYISNTH